MPHPPRHRLDYRAEPRMPRDLKTPPPERLLLPGPVGNLDATLERPGGEARAAVLHLHPHPVHGGTRQNNVVRHGALGSLQAGCAALRIDFRGVGRSEGEYDEGLGEIDDAEAAFAWLEQEFPGLPIYLWGFSFGSRVGLDLGIRIRERVAGYMAVAWPTNFYPWPNSTDWPEPAAFLAGTADEFVDFSKMGPAEDHQAKIEIVEDVGHFFPGRLELVREYPADTLENWLDG
ncbi:MAG: alpha/beta hydrolase [Planctomycetota bacterium]